MVELDLEKNSANSPWLHNLPECKHDPESLLHDRKLGQEIMLCINKLPENQKAVFLMCELENHDTRDICNKHDIKSGHVYVLLHRAKNALKVQLESHWSNP